MIEGVKVNLGGREFIAPPLNFRALRKIQPKLADLTALGAVPTPEQLQTVVEIVHLALVRNYPELAIDELDDLLDLGNIPDVLAAIMAASGLEKTVPGEETATAPATP